MDTRPWPSRSFGRAVVADSGRRVHVPYAEDDGHAVGGPEAGFDQPDDAVDDACAFWVFHPAVFQWPGHILGGLQYRRYDHPGVRHRLESYNRPVKDRTPKSGFRGWFPVGARYRLGDLY